MAKIAQEKLSSKKPRVFGKKPNPEEQMKRRAAKKAYDYRKTQVMMREEENDRYVILFQSNNEWWKIAGKSVLYYAYLIAPRLGKKVKIWPDNDYASTSKEGIVQIRGIDELLTEVGKLGLKAEKFETSGYARIKLLKKITEEELNAMRGEEAREWEMAERMVMPVVLWPGLTSEVSELMRMTWYAAKGLDAPAQRAFGNKMVNTVQDMVDKMTRASHNEIPIIDALSGMLDDAETMEGLLFSTTVLRLFSSKRNYELATILEKVKNRAGKELEKYEKDNKKSKKRASNKKAK